MSGSAQTYADQVIQTAMAAASGGLDLEVAGRVVHHSLEAMEKQTLALMNATYDPRSFDKISRALLSTTKAVDSLFHLVHFAKGQLDSRPGTGGTDWLDCLTDEQLHQVQRWVEEYARREEEGRVE